MLRTDLLVGRYQTVEVLHRYDCGELVRAEAEAAAPVLLLLPASESAGRAERRRLETLSGAGTPRAVRWLGGPGAAGALVLDLPPDARPLYALAALPPVTLRSGLVRLLRTLSRAHSRGLVHGAISRASILADPCGEFWLADWSLARPAAGADADVAADLEALGRAFVAALRRQPWPDAAPAAEPDVEIEELRFPGLSRDFARVLVRVVAGDPRTRYRSATEVLADLGYPDTTDPWAFVPYVAASDHVERVEGWLRAAREPPDGEVRSAPTVAEVVGAHGAGKSRLLGEIAARLRVAGAVVFHARSRTDAAWGGLGEIARQLAQFVPDGPLHEEHAEVLAVLTGETSAGPADGAAAATAALCDLVRAAFSEASGALLLDDADELRPAPRETWRALCRYLAAVNDDGAGIQVVVVSTTVKPSAPEPDARREQLSLPEWSAEHLGEFLGRVLANPAAARDVAAPLLAAAGGCPGEVVEYLRDLERGGGLIVEGARWRFETPLHALGAWTPGIAEYVRRAMTSVGPDARALVETLAVATECRVSRADVGRLAELTGPRLWQAAEKAVDAGLLRVAGTTWTVRTEAIRRKVYAGIGEGRRRSLHREFLHRILDRRPPDLVAAAHHSCACGDARAAERTEQALEHLTATHSYDAAIRLLEHAATTLGEPGWGRSRHLQLATLRGRAGRLGEAIDQLNTLLDDPITPPATAAQARLALVEAHYYARQWEDAIAVPLPPPPADPDLLAQIRLLRAASHLYLGRMDPSAREARLAMAELGDRCLSTRVRLLRLELAYREAFLRSEWERAQDALVAKLRISVAAAERYDCARDLTRFANLSRLRRRPRLTESVLSWAEASAAERLPYGHDVRMAILDTRALLLEGTGASTAERLRHAEMAFHSSLQVSDGPDRLYRRVELVRARLSDASERVADVQYVMSLASQVPALSRTALLGCGVSLGLLCVHFGLQATLDEMEEAFPERGSPYSRVRLIRANAVLGRLLLGVRLRSDEEDLLTDAAGVEEFCARIASLSRGTNLATLDGAVRGRDTGAWLAAPAYLIRRGGWMAAQWPSGWTAGRLVGWISTPSHADGRAALALALGLWAPIPWDETAWGSILSAVRGPHRRLPMALEWQRLLLESHAARRAGDRCRSVDLRREAVVAARSLGRHECGPIAAAASAEALRVLGEPAARSGRPRSSSSSRAVSSSSVRSGGAWRGPFRAWGDKARLVARMPRALVRAPHVAEAHEFLRRAGVQLRQEDCPGVARWSNSAYIMFPSLMSEAGRAEALGRVRAVLRYCDSLVGVFVEDPSRCAESSAPGRALVEVCDGARVVLPELAADAQSRLELFEWVLRRRFYDMVVSECAALEIRAYPWQGGIAEMEGIVAAIGALAVPSVTRDVLRRIGWESRHKQGRPGTGCDLDSRVIHALRATPCCGIRALALSTAAPRRSVQRSLRRLVAQGLIRRIGRGPATTYALPTSP